MSNKNERSAQAAKKTVQFFGGLSSLILGAGGSPGGDARARERGALEIVGTFSEFPKVYDTWRGEIKGLVEQMRPDDQRRMRALLKSLKPVIKLDFNAFCVQIVGLPNQKPQYQKFVEELRNLEQLVGHLIKTVRTPVTHLEVIVEPVRSSLKTMTTTAKLQCIQVKRHVLDRDAKPVFLGIFSLITERAERALLESEPHLQPEIFAAKQAAATGTEERFQDNLTKLIEGATKTVSTMRPAVNSFLSDLQAWFRSERVAIPGGLFISYSWSEAGSKESSWLQPFLRTLHSHLLLSGVEASLDVRSADARSNIFKFMEDRLAAAQYVVLIGTPSLLTKHQHRVSMLHEELARIRQKRARAALAGERSVVIPVNLSANHQRAFPAGYEGYTNIRDWPSRDYLTNLQELIGYVYDVYENPVYQQKWTEFFQRLKTDYGYTMHLAAEDRELVPFAARAADNPLTAGGGGGAVVRSGRDYLW
jgi:hypothetical protein